MPTQNSTSQAQTAQPLVKDFKASKGSANRDSFIVKNALLLFVLLLVLGLGTGFVGALVMSGGGKTGAVTTSTGEVVEEGDLKKGTVVGSDDTKTFSDEASGTLVEGGIDGEGAYHLERPGGESQNVYMTSSVVDLAPMVGKKVKVWGKTFAGEKAGWLMDVGRVEVLE
jgi:hypothetical protein